MNEQTPIYQEFLWAVEHVEKLVDRRQTTTSFFLSVNTAILAGIGLLSKDVQIRPDWLMISIVMLLISGLLSSSLKVL